MNDLNTARDNTNGSGIATSGLLYGGQTPGGGVTNTESWNGTSWTEVNDLNTAREYLGALGPDNTNALAFGGLVRTPVEANVANTENWNGTSWSEVNDLNTARIALAGAGTNTTGLAFGGSNPAKVAITEEWNGASWSEVADLSTARNGLAGAGSQTSALAIGGNDGSVTAATEEWSSSSNTVKTISTS